MVEEEKAAYPDFSLDPKSGGVKYNYNRKSRLELNWIRDPWVATRKKYTRRVFMAFISHPSLSPTELCKLCVTTGKKRSGDFVAEVLTPMRVAGLLQMVKVGKFAKYSLTKEGAYAMIRYGMTSAMPAGLSREDAKEVAAVIEKERAEQWQWTKNKEGSI